MFWLIVDVDTEFDYLRPGYSGDWRRDNPGLTKGVPELLEFFHEREIKATFHVQEQSDPNLSVLFRYPKVYEMIENYGQEISLHVHVMQDDYKTRKKEIATAFQRLKDHGYKITAFRAGWYFTNENTIKILEELGIKYDCSPYKNLPVGPMNWCRIPDSPYHPSYSDVTRVGEAKILMIPITDWRLGISIHRNVDYELELMKKGVEALLSASQEVEQPVILYFTTHSWKPVEVNTASLRMWERKRREKFFDFLSQFEYKTLTVSEAGSLWEEKGYEPYWLKLPNIIGRYISPLKLSRYTWAANHIVPVIRNIKYRVFGRL